MKRMRKIIALTMLCTLAACSLTACGPVGNLINEMRAAHEGRDGGPGQGPRKAPHKAGETVTDEAPVISQDGKGYNGPDEETYRILAENGYGEGIDWSKQTDDDPNIKKSMDVTQDIDSVIKAYRKRFGSDYETYNDYEKPWWEYIPDDYDLTGDTFPSTPNFVGREKHYNNSLEQNIIDDGLTSGQLTDLDSVKRLAESFIYEENLKRFKWTADMDKACAVAESLNIADFDAKSSIRPMLSGDGHWINPISMTAYYEQSILAYDLIGLPTFGGYKFSIDVWEDKGKLVGWIDEFNDTFMNEKEVYENMGEWDFYDSVSAANMTSKVVKPKLPNGAKMLKGDKTGLSREQYIYDKFPGGGMIYYYGNGITVDMTFFDGKSGGSFEDALKYCRMICGNDH